MKYLTCIIFISFSFLESTAQAIDYNTIILPSNIQNISIEEKLVQLAWDNNPENIIEINNLEIASRSVDIYRAEWLDIFRMQLNANEGTINPASIPEGRNFFYPRYNFSATVRLGMFVDVPAKTKIAKLQVKNQEENINARKLFLRSLVLRRWETYQLNKELLKIQSTLTDDVYSNFLIAEQQFKNGNILVEEYNQFLRAYNDQLVFKLQKQTALEIAKIDLEELIGVRLEDLLETSN